LAKDKEKKLLLSLLIREDYKGQVKSNHLKELKPLHSLTLCFKVSNQRSQSKIEQLKIGELNEIPQYVEKDCQK